MKYILLIVSSVFLLSMNTTKPDIFNRLQCDKNNIKDLINFDFPQGSVFEIESKHKAIGLKFKNGDLKAQQTYGLSFWDFCSNEYAFLTKQDKTKIVIADVLLIPKEFKEHPKSLPGSNCQKNQKKITNDTFYVLEKKTSSHVSQVKWAQEIDKKKIKFKKIDSAGMTCSLE